MNRRLTRFIGCFMILLALLCVPFASVAYAEESGSGLEDVSDSVKKEMVFGWSVERVSMPSTSARVGESFTSRACPQGSHSNLTYDFTWTNEDGTAGTFCTGSSSSLCDCSFSSPGLHTITATATDADGIMAWASKNVYIYDLIGVQFFDNGDSFMVKPDIGCNLTSVSGLTYRYTWASESGASGTLKDWSANPWCSFTAARLSGAYGEVTVTIEAADDLGSLGSVSTTFELDWELTGLSIESTSARAGSPFTTTVRGKNLPAGMTYTYSWTKNGGGSGTFVSNSSSSSRSFTLSDTGLYTITATAKDASGATASVSKNIYIYKLTGSSLSLSSGTYTFKPTMGTDTKYLAGVTYRYTWRSADGSSGVLKEWSTDAWCGFTQSRFSGRTGEITVTVEAHDAAGSLGTASKTFTPSDKMTQKAQSFYSPTGYLILVDCYNNWVGVYQGYQGSWTRIRHMRCTTGAPETPTIKGTFYLTNDRGYVFGYGYSCYHYTQFYGDYLFHSVLYDEGTFNIQDGRLGMSLSHGCVRLAIDDAEWIRFNMPYGTTVHTYI